MDRDRACRKYCYNVAGMHHFFAEATEALPARVHRVRMEFAYAGGGLGKGGHVTLYVDDKKVGEGTVPMTQAMVFSADDGCDVGEDGGAPVSPNYGSRGNAFNEKGQECSACHRRSGRELGSPRLAGRSGAHRNGTAVMASRRVTGAIGAVVPGIYSTERRLWRRAARRRMTAFGMGDPGPR